MDLHEPHPGLARPVAVAQEELPGLSWSALFGNERPVELEIGCGKAGFLLRRAQAVAQHNFLGLEWANEFYKFAVDRMTRWKVSNVRVLRTDAALFIRTICPRHSLTALHIYHPDPWPKKRHHKRRLFQPAFLDAAVACLVVGGRIAVQSDHAEYFALISALLQRHPLLEESEFFDPRWHAGLLPADAAAAAATDELRVATNFELKYRKEGRSIYRIAAIRKP